MVSISRVAHKTDTGFVWLELPTGIGAPARTGGLSWSQSGI